MNVGAGDVAQGGVEILDRFGARVYQSDEDVTQGASSSGRRSLDISRLDAFASRVGEVMG
jgi:hypothetical protein